MPIGVYFRTVQHKEALKKAANNRSVEWKENVTKHLRKLALARIGTKRPPFSEEWKLRIGIGHKGQKSWCTGKFLSKEHCEKLSKAHFGKKLSKEHCESIRKSLIGHRRYAPQNRLSITDPKAYRQLPHVKMSIKAISHTRRNAGKLSKELVQEIYEDNIKQHGTLTCYLCRKPIIFGNDQLEHKFPISKGGKNVKDNLDIACKKCNLKKGSSIIICPRMET